jgi:biopolymer transport protein TolQ
MEMNNVLWHIISQTDVISRSILFLLLSMSVVCWAVTFYKLIILRTKMRQLAQAQFLLNNVVSLEDFLAQAARLHDSFVADLIAHYLTDFKKVLKFYENSKEPIKDTDWYMLQGDINQLLDNAIHKEEAILPLLSTSAQAAPLIGLFGTVWGLINSFLALAQQRTADISAVAPGIAEALITTLGGLVVAIPALIMFNYLLGQVRMLEQRLVVLSDTCLWIMRSASAQKSIFDVHNSPIFVATIPAKRETL